MKRGKSKEIQEFIVSNVHYHSTDIGRLTAEKFGISRVAVTHHLKSLGNSGLLTAEGKTKARRYGLKILAAAEEVLQITPYVHEDEVWRRFVLPQLGEAKGNIHDLCSYGFTEIFNNVIDHSESSTTKIIVARDAAKITIIVRDYGVGIFHKIQQALNLSEPQHAILELAKGKLTTDRTKHTGEGVFFTSRMFDEFMIASGTLIFNRLRRTDDWLHNSDQAPVNGTDITMIIFTNSSHTTKDIFDKYKAEFDEYGFSKTIIPLALLRYEGEQLISRSQAKRLMTRVDKFSEVVLNFKDITVIGQAFADEIFRVYRSEHPNVHVYPTHTTNDVKGMIKRIVMDNPEDPLNKYFATQEDLSS